MVVGPDDVGDLCVAGGGDSGVSAVVRGTCPRARFFEGVEDAVGRVRPGGGLLVLAPGYPARQVQLSSRSWAALSGKHVRVYIEFPLAVPDVQFAGPPVALPPSERAVAVYSRWTDDLAPLSLLAVTDCHIVPVELPGDAEPMLEIGRVAGFDRAAYGLADVDSSPLLFRRGDCLIATTALSAAIRARYAPTNRWRTVWQHILRWLTRDNALQVASWSSTVTPALPADEQTSSIDRRLAISRGVEWFERAKLLVHPGWEPDQRAYQSNIRNPCGPPPPPATPVGDGTLGIIEGPASRIHADGSQDYRYMVRNDVQGEVAFALSSAAPVVSCDRYRSVAANLVDAVLRNRQVRGPDQLQGDPCDPRSGLLGWAQARADQYYQDDNARAVLGCLGTAAELGTHRWNRDLARIILANFRTTGRQGFRGHLLEERELLEHGWRYYFDRDLVHPHPHFEAWMWACYLWLYDKTGYRPLLDRTLKAIELTMRAYPDEWEWTNGFQQERARMLLPLAWLVRVEDTPLHRAWLDQMAAELLQDQDGCGGIREALGAAGKGQVGPEQSNAMYGQREAPLIFRNGDPVADLLYTNNFALLGLIETAAVTGNDQHRDAALRLADFLTRIQVKSDAHRCLDGAWFRGFDLRRWEYWGSNGDSDWGTWCTLTGWIQSWIIVGLTLIEWNTSYWQMTRQSRIQHVFLDVQQSFLPS